MTRAEFNEIDTWEELQATMQNADYYEELDGDLYTSENEVVCGIFSAARQWDTICDVQRADLGELDDSAAAWIASDDFTYVRNYYWDEFGTIKRDFAAWLGDEWFDDDDEDDLLDNDDDDADIGIEPEKDDDDIIEDAAIITMLFGA